MKRMTTGVCAALVAFASACASTTVTRGTPRAVAQAAADAYVAAGHECAVKADLAYCDTSGRRLPLLMGYSKTSQELLFATVYDTEAAFGRACPSLPADQVMRPEWMIVKCDEIEFDNKTKKVVLSVLGGGRIPDHGMSRAELNRSAGLFIQEAEAYLVRLKSHVSQTERTAAPSSSPSLMNDTHTTKL